LEQLEDRVVPPTIVWSNRNSDGLYGNGFTTFFGADAELAKRDVDAALLAWQNVIADFNMGVLNGVTVDIHMGSDLGFSAAASTSVLPNGHPIGGSITINLGTAGVPDGGWYLDPTPQYSEEFRGDISGAGMGTIVNPYVSKPTPGGPADGKNDLYSIVAIEM